MQLLRNRRKIAQVAIDILDAQPSTAPPFGRQPAHREDAATETFARLKPERLRLRSLRRWIDKRLRPAVAFVARCAGAATCAYFVADRIGLPHPLWATISALMVPQEKLAETNNSLWAIFSERLLGSAGEGWPALRPPIWRSTWPGKSRCQWGFARFWRAPGRRPGSACGPDPSCS